MRGAEGVVFEWRDWRDLDIALLYELLRFRQAVFVVEQASPYPDLDGRDARAEHLLVRRGDSLIGCLRVLDPDPLVRIGRVAVAVEERGRGLARAMMQAALQRAGERHPHRDVAVDAQTYLEPFYRSLGFSAVAAPYDDFGVPHVTMIGPPGSG